MEAIVTLAVGIAHDFDNILHSILGNAEILSEDLPKDSESQTDIADIILFSHEKEALQAFNLNHTNIHW